MANRNSPDPLPNANNPPIPGDPLTEPPSRGAWATGRTGAWLVALIVIIALAFWLVNRSAEPADGPRTPRTQEMLPAE